MPLSVSLFTGSPSLALFILLVALLPGAAVASDSGLAQELTNPIADLVTIPIQMTFDDDVGPGDGHKLTTNVQPVIPFDMGEDWNLITRTILPIISQKDIVPGSGSQFGLGDTSLSLFVSPKKAGPGGIIWGAGPVLLLPTATNSRLGAEKWGAGPAAVGLVLQGPWTLGMLANHVWSFAGDGDRADISNTFLQPFAAYTWPSAWTVSIQSETTYNWEVEEWSVPVTVGLSRLVMFGRLPVSLQGGIGYWVESSRAGPEGVRFRLQANIVLPKGGSG